jgi:hypothetical protein
MARQPPTSPTRSVRPPHIPGTNQNILEMISSLCICHRCFGISRQTALPGHHPRLPRGESRRPPRGATTDLHSCFCCFKADTFAGAPPTSPPRGVTAAPRAPPTFLPRGITVAPRFVKIRCTSLDGQLGESFNQELYRTVQFPIREHTAPQIAKQLQEGSHSGLVDFLYYSTLGRE